MKNKGRRHMSGIGPHANGNCKGYGAGLTRDIRSMASGKDRGMTKEGKKHWHKRVRGYFKSQTKDIL